MCVSRTCAYDPPHTHTESSDDPIDKVRRAYISNERPGGKSFASKDEIHRVLRKIADHYTIGSLEKALAGYVDVSGQINIPWNPVLIEDIVINFTQNTLA
jgi:hypothetical protein